MTPEEALAYIEACRDSHVPYAAGLGEELSVADAITAAGDVTFHANCVRDYDAALAALRPLVKRSREGAGQPPGNPVE